MNRPWMPLYIADYRADTTRLSTIEHGAYLLLIMEYWRASGLPDDDKQLSRITGLPVAQWRRMRPIIQSFFHDGWKHKRIDEELAHCLEVSNKRKAAVEQREINRRSNDASSDDTLHTSHSKKEVRKKAIRAVVSTTRPGNVDFQRFWSAYPRRKGSNPKTPAEKLFSAAVKQGQDPEKIIAAIDAGAGFDRDKIGTEFIPQAVKWLRDKRWEEYLDGTEADTARRKVFIKRDDPRYSKWLAHLGKTSTPIFNDGWFFEAEEPPVSDPVRSVA